MATTMVVATPQNIRQQRLTASAPQSARSTSDASGCNDGGTQFLAIACAL
eukprot:m.176820 g.176820  ORF g.176820 m.176820 type:complete len:50 (+) comp24460_c0_seq1:2589-2738(+)